MSTQITRQTTIGQGSDWNPMDHAFGPGSYLMGVFDNTTALDQATKERIKHRVWARVRSVRDNPFPESDAFIVIGTLFGGLLTTVGLSVLWSGGHGALARVGAVAVSLLTWLAAFLVISDAGLGRFERLGPALYLGVAAISVLGIQSAPLARAAHIPVWTIAGLRAGLVGFIVFDIGLLVVWLGEPVFRWLGDRKKWSEQPETGIIVGLLYLLGNLKRLEYVYRNRDELILGTIARNKRVNELMQQLSLDGTRQVHTSSSTDVKKQRNGTFLETFHLESRQDDGSWETVLHEERVMTVPDMFQEDPQWKTTRRDFVNRVEDVARYIERGLSARLNVGNARLDAWLKKQLHGRAQTVRSWGQLVAFPSKVSYQDLLVQVGTTLEHAAEEQWAAIPIHNDNDSEAESWSRRILRLARPAAVGIIPLLVVIAAPKVGIVIPPALRDALLTFAVPWILLQIIELIVPNAGEYVSRSKSLRELLPSRRSDKE